MTDIGEKVRGYPVTTEALLAAMMIRVFTDDRLKDASKDTRVAALYIAAEYLENEGAQDA